MFPIVALVLVMLVAPAGAPDAADYFRITVVDEQTGRGVPLVELKTVDSSRYYTDSNGIVAFREPGLMDREVFFHVKSHGYEFPKDGFGFAGKTLKVTPGGNAELRIKRLNIAERLYRVTGYGIYRESVLTHRPVPLEQPLLNGLVTGSDSVVNAIYGGQLYWFWGDTNRPAYPLGNFQVTGAISRLPAEGGLPPQTGVDLAYFTDDSGFAKQMAPVPGDGPTWIDGLVTLRDRSGRERMFAVYAKVRANMEAYERGWLVFNDDDDRFDKVAPMALDAPILPGGHTFVRRVDGADYVYFCRPFPTARVRADPERLLDLAEYEAFTCLQAGSRLNESRLEHDADGTLHYAWKRNTPPLGMKAQTALVDSGKLKPAEALIQTKDVQTGKSVSLHSGSVCWNAHRARWVMIAVEVFGTSFLGEVWYAEADTPLGPWVYARKVVTHDDYSFYNPKQHPYFDQNGGRIIYFEGTYSQTFSGNKDPTPRYDYNQIMYRLDLSDPRLVLPVAIYDSAGRGAPRDFTSRRTLRPGARRRVAFFALDRSRPDAVPIHARRETSGGVRLVAGETAASTPAGDAVFFALPAGLETAPSVPLYEFTAEGDREWLFSVDPSERPGYRRRESPVCRVWPNPMQVELPDE